MKNIIASIYVCILASYSFALEEGDFPVHVDVKGVFFVPSGEAGPTHFQKGRFMRHLRLAHTYYKSILMNRDTFSLAKGEPQVVHGKFPIEHYKGKTGVVSISPLSEIFDVNGMNRFNCPHVFAVIVMNSRENNPRGGGRPFNPALNSGGGVLLTSSYSLDNNRGFQGMLQHELGHCFGLVHVSAYGYDQRNNPSVMSYIKDPWIDFKATKNRGKFIPEDIRTLSLNKRVFPKLYFDPSTDVPADYKLHPLVRLVPKEIIPGQKPYRINVHTDCGAGNDSAVSNIVHGLIKTANYSFKSSNMWISDVSPTGWVQVDFAFPVAVTLNKICVHSRCSVRDYPAQEVRIQAKIDSGYMDVSQQELSGADAYVSFAKQKAATWRLHFRTDKSGQVVIRGIRFFSPQCEVFNQNYPWQ